MNKMQMNWEQTPRYVGNFDKPWKHLPPGVEVVGFSHEKKTMGSTLLPAITYRNCLGDQFTKIVTQGCYDREHALKERYDKVVQPLLALKKLLGELQS